MKKITFLIIVLLLSTPFSSAQAVIKTFIKEYTYQASEYDSKVICRVLALEQVKRLLLEELGTYLESETEVKNFQLDKDKIIVLTAGIVNTEVIKEKWDGKSFYLVARIKADPDKVLTAIDSLRKDRKKAKDLEISREKADNLLKEIEIAKKELSLEKIKGGKTNSQKGKEYERKVRSLSAIDWYNIGNQLNRDALPGIIDEAYWNKQKQVTKDAIVAFSNAISLNKDYVEAYIGRGVMYASLKLYKQALIDFNKAIELDPESSDAYSSRAGTFAELGDFDKLMSDYDRAIALTPDNVDLYYCRAIDLSFYASRNFGRLGLEQAVKDIGKVIDMKPKAVYYIQRGVCYSKLGNNELAISDYSKAIGLEPEPSHYHIRADFYEKIGQYQNAIEDYGKVIGLKPHEKNSYLDRSELYEKMGRFEDAERDLEKVIELDPEWGFLAKFWRLFDKKKYNEAIVAVNKGIELAFKKNPNKMEKFISIGFLVRSLCYYNLKNDQGALRELNEGIKIVQDDFKMGFNAIRALVYIRLGNIQDAVADINRLKVEKASSYANRGFLYLVVKYYPQAVREFEKVMAMDPKDGKKEIERAIGVKNGAHVEYRINVDDLDIPGTFEILLKKYPKFRKKYLSTQPKEDFSAIIEKSAGRKTQ